MSILPMSYFQLKPVYQYANPTQDPALPFQHPLNVDALEQMLFTRASVLFRSINRGGNLNKYEFFRAMSQGRTELFPGRDTGSLGEIPKVKTKVGKGKIKNKGKGKEKEKIGGRKMKGPWHQLYSTLDYNRNGYISEREFCEFYVFCLKNPQLLCTQMGGQPFGQMYGMTPTSGMMGGTSGMKGETMTPMMGSQPIVGGSNVQPGPLPTGGP